MDEYCCGAQGICDCRKVNQAFTDIVCSVLHTRKILNKVEKYGRSPLIEIFNDPITVRSILAFWDLYEISMFKSTSYIMHRSYSLFTYRFDDYG